MSRVAEGKKETVSTVIVEETTFVSRGAEPVKLEGKLHLFEERETRPAVIVLHPSSRGDCDMEHPVVLKLCEVLNGEGFITLRFNFRGNGRSEGQLTRGRQEVGDIKGALDFLLQKAPVDRQRLCIVGHSFGAAMALRSTVEDERLQGAVAIALPLALMDPPGSFFFPYYHWDARGLQTLARPKHFITGSQDPVCPPVALSEFVQGLAPPASYAVIEGADHFFSQTRRRQDLHHPHLLALAEEARKCLVSWLAR